MHEHVIEPIAIIRTDFKEKFGIPRQCGLVPELVARIEFTPPYSNADALRGLEGFSHMWLIWGFSENYGRGWSPLVRPPRLGGKTKVGVWASRSPFRPNNLAMSVVKIIEVNTEDQSAPYIVVSGADMLDGTPIYDIKPYAAYSDSIPEAVSGFAVPARKFIDVADPNGLLESLEETRRRAIIGILEQDPRAAYDKKPGYVFGMKYADYDIKFTADDELITIVAVEEVDND